MPEGGAEHVDVVIVGVGLSGVSAACLLRSKCPGKRLAVLEATDVSGGT
jgi:monooxygenase